MSDIYLSLTETPSVVTLSQPVISGALSSTVTVANTVTVALDANSLSALENVTVTVGAAVSVSNFPATQVVSVGNFPASQVVTGTVALDSASLAALENVTVTVGAAISGTVTVANFPSTQTIAGTVTANGGDGTFLVGGLRGGSKTAFPMDVSSGYLQTKVESMPAISGTVTANLSSTNLNSVTIGVRGSVTASIENSVTIASLPAISGTVTANVDLSPILPAFKTNNEPAVDTGVQISWWDDDADESRLVRPSQPLPISGAVTANSNFAGTNGTTLPSNIAILGAEEDGTGNAKTLQADGSGFLKVSLQESGVSIDGKIFAWGGISDVDITATTDGSKNRLDVSASGTVTASSVQGTSVTTSNFTSTTASTTLASANSARRGLTVFNEGAGNLHICAGATATTLAYQVRLSAGDYWECPAIQTSLTHSAQFASAGTARVVEII